MSAAEAQCRYNPDPPEISLAGSRAELAAVAERLAAPGSIELAQAPSGGPYPVVLSSLTVVVRPGSRVRIVVDGPAIQVEGDAAKLADLAANIRGLADEGEVGAHQHIEWFPDHWYLAEESTPLVLELLGDRPPTGPLRWTFLESPERGIDLDLGDQWPGFVEALADSVSSVAPRNDSTSGLSTYWIDLLIFRLRHWHDDDGREQVLVEGNTTAIVKVSDEAVARSLYELFDDERMPVQDLLPALEDWRVRVLARGGDFDIPERYQRNPIEMPGGPS